MAYECLTNLVGITQSECTCVITGLDNDILDEGLAEGIKWYTQSTSGLYLDELEGIIPLQSADGCAECDDEMANFYYRSRNSAVKTLADDVMAGFIKRGVNGNRTYFGKVAGTLFSGFMDVSGSGYAGQKIWTVAMNGGSIKINKIYAMMNASATFDVLVYMVERGATEFSLVTTITDIVSIANTVKENILPAPVTIDLSRYGAEFYLLYVPAGFMPLQNSLSCGCGQKEYLLRDYLTVSGVKGNDLNALSTFGTYTNGGGLALDAQVGCDTTKLICEAYNYDEAAKIVMAYAARYKAGELLHEYVLKSNEINRYTMSSREFLWGKRNHFKKEYADRVAWLVENIDMDLIDCYICNDKKVRKSGLLV